MRRRIKRLARPRLSSASASALIASKDLRLDAVKNLGGDSWYIRFLDKLPEARIRFR